jgi:hypothetical protein
MRAVYSPSAAYVGLQHIGYRYRQKLRAGWADLNAQSRCYRDPIDFFFGFEFETAQLVSVTL